MSKALALFNNRPVRTTNAAQYFGESNIKERQTVPSVTYGGKEWTLNVNGQKHRLTKRDESGDEVPVGILRVVVLDYADRMGRTYYPGEYDPEKPGQPECWSDDGRKPHPSVPEPKANACENCPLSAKGSKISAQGKAVTACGQHRMVVVVPANNLGEFPPLRLKLAVTSNYDKKSPELEASGWFAFQQYVDLLRANRVAHSGELVTKMKFDPNANYPKVIFSTDRWLDDSELATVGPMASLPEVKQLLSGTWTPNGADGTRIEGPKAAPAPAKAAPVEDDEDDAVVIPSATMTKTAAPKAPVKIAIDDDEDEAPKPVAKKAAPAAKKAKPTPVDDDEDDVPAAKPVKAKPAPAASEDDLDELMGEWGDD